MDHAQLCSSRLLGFLAILCVVLVSTQITVGAALASPAASDSSHHVAPADSESPLNQLEPSTASDDLSVEFESSFTDTEFESEIGDRGIGQGTTQPSGESLPSEIGISESTVNTISSHAEDVSPPAFLTLLGYSRYDNSDPLENEIRAALHDRIQSDAGVTLAQLTSDTDVSESTVRYHTRILEEESLVEKVDLWGNVRLFPAAYEPAERALTVALDDTALRSVLSAVGRYEPATVSTVAEEIDRAPSTVSHHLSRLEAADLVDQERDGKRVVTTLEPAVRRALNTGTVEIDTRTASVGD